MHQIVEKCKQNYFESSALKYEENDNEYKSLKRVIELKYHLFPA